MFGTEHTIFPRRHRNGQHIFEKMLSFISFKRNTNPNHLMPIRMTLSIRQIISVEEDVEIRDPHTRLIGM